MRHIVIGQTDWIEDGAFTRPVDLTYPAAIAHYPGNGFEAWVYPQKMRGRCLGSFATKRKAAFAITKHYGPGFTTPRSN